MKKRIWQTAWLVSVGVFLAGCQSAQPRTTDTDTDVPRDSSAELMIYLGDQPYVEAEPGYRAAYFLHAGAAFPGDFGELRAKLVTDKIADDWDHGPRSRLTRADVGYLICRACDIRTGVNWTLLGLGRYAYRELQYHQIAGPGGDLGLVSGGEFLGIVRKADEYKRHVGQTSDYAELGERG